MKHYRSLLLLPFVLTGCATTDMQGRWIPERTVDNPLDQSGASGYARKRSKPQQLAGHSTA
jgi:hypothetical protein